MLTTLDYMNIFHETKNSITLINSSLQLIAKKHPEVTGYEFWNETMLELSYLKELILELSQSRAGYPLNICPVDIYSFTQEILDSIRSLSENQNFSCQTTIEENLPPIFMDALRMKQAVINLLKNAYEAMGETGTVRLDIYRKDDFLEMDVIDSGGGISDDVKDAFFDIFVTSKECGTGLGLPITHQIVEEHSGKLLYESRPGDGCTFSILLPLKPKT